MCCVFNRRLLHLKSNLEKELSERKRVEEAREELDEQAEYLSEDHIEEIEELLCETEDSYDYIKEHGVEDD
jgi:uncharacterized membrane-anchored protein YhcB (DUF1043 family)